MKINRVLLLCGAAALPQLAMADLSSTNPQGLGDVHGLLAYCAKIDPADAASFNDEWNNIVSGAPTKQLNTVETGGPYKQGYDTITAALKNLSKQQSLSICQVSAVAWNGKGKVSSGDDDRGAGASSGTKAPRPERDLTPEEIRKLKR